MSCCFGNRLCHDWGFPRGLQQHGLFGEAQTIVLELKIKRYSLEKTIEDGLIQTWEYMDKVGSIAEGHFIIFDRTPGKTWEEKIWHAQHDYNGNPIMVWGM